MIAVIKIWGNVVTCLKIQNRLHGRSRIYKTYCVCLWVFYRLSRLVSILVLWIYFITSPVPTINLWFWFVVFNQRLDSNTVTVLSNRMRKKTKRKKPSSSQPIPKYLRLYHISFIICSVCFSFITLTFSAAVSSGLRRDRSVTAGLADNQTLCCCWCYRQL